MADADPADRDHDGFDDTLDKCPDVVGMAPDGCPPTDGDADGVLDHADECPGVAGPEVNHGCPFEDPDGDGLVAPEDDCPLVFGHRRHRGCPVPDADDDAVPDRRDRCATTREVWNGRRDRDGCPDAGRAIAIVGGGSVVITRIRALYMAVAVLRSVSAGRLRIEVVAEYGLSYGDSIMRAERRAATVKKSLAKSLRIVSRNIDVSVLGPDGRPRITINYR